jgi:hypothetical protein
VIFDAGVFIALENPSKRRVVLAVVEKLRASGVSPSTTETALAQAWRNPANQVPMTMLVNATTVYPFGEPQVVGRKCAVSCTSDVVDASLAVLSEQLDTAILTTDPDDMAQLGADFREL